MATPKGNMQEIAMREIDKKSDAEEEFYDNGNDDDDQDEADVDSENCDGHDDEPILFIIESLPKNTDFSYLVIYLENRIEKDDIRIEEEMEDAAVISIWDATDEEVPRLLESINKTDKLFFGSHLSMQRAPKRNCVLVTNISSNMDDVQLSLFFEQRQLNPNGMAVDVVEYCTTKKAAIIRYEDVSAVYRVLEWNASFLGDHVEMQICPSSIQSRGLSCLNIQEESTITENLSSSQAESLAMSRSSEDLETTTEKSENDQSGKDAANANTRSGTRRRKKASRISDPLAASSQKGNSHSYSENFDSVSERPYCEYSVPNYGRNLGAEYNVGNFPSYGSEGHNVSYVDDSHLHKNNLGKRGANTRGRYARGRISSQAYQRQIPSLFEVNTSDSRYGQNMQDSRSRGAAGFQRGWRGADSRRMGRGRGYRNVSGSTNAINEAGMSFSRSESYQDSVDGINSAGRRGCQQGDRRGYGRQINQRGRVSQAGRKNSLASSATGLSEDANNVQDGPKYSKKLSVGNESSNEKCQLLILMATDLAKKKGGWMYIDKAAHDVTISGSSEELVDEIHCRVLECLGSSCSVRIHSLSDDLLSKLLEGEGMRWIQRNIFRAGGHKAVLYRDRDGFARLLSTSEEAAHSALDYLKSALHVERIPFNSSLVDYLKSEQWTTFITEVENKSSPGKPGPAPAGKDKGGLLIVTVDMTNLFILLEGSLSVVNSARDLIQAEIKNHEKNVIELPLTDVKQLRLFKSELSSFRSTGATAAIDEDKMTMQLSGPPEILERAWKEVERLLEVKSQTFTVCRAGITSTQFLTKDSLLHLHVQNLEHVNECVITAEEISQKSQTSEISDRLESSQYKVSPNRTSLKRSNLRVVKGDITKCQADVLVNPLCGDSAEMKKAGTVSAAFSKAGGVELEESFMEASSGPKRTGVITAAYGNINALKVFHIRIRKYSTDDPNKSVKKMQSKIDWCIKTAAQLNMKSITFPTLGCGLLKYPMDTVANCFATAASANPQFKVTVIAYDEETFQFFSNYLSQDAVETLNMTKLLRQKRFVRNSLKFTIQARDMTRCNKVKNELEAIIENCLSKVGLQYDGLGSSDVADILSHQSADVHINIDEVNKKIYIEGAKQPVEVVNDKVSRLLDTVYKRSVKSAEQKFSTLQVESARKSTADGILAPSYWTKYKRDISSFASDTKVHLTPIPTSHPIFVSLLKIINDTWDSSRIGQGSDALGLQHSRIAVKSITLVENVTLYKRYQRSKIEKNMDITSGGGSFTSIGRLPGGKEVATITAADATLNQMFDKKLNECYLFHGTHLDKKDGIIHTGLDGRLGSQRALFGQGIYFAESSTKADQYSDGRQSRTSIGTTLYMFIVKVLLGRSYLCQAPQPFKRPPCSNPSCYSDTCSIASHLPLHDSVIGTHNFIQGGAATRALLFREFVLYDASFCYPEFLVEYVRI